MLHDGAGVGSVERATMRKATSTGSSGSSAGSTSTRRRKTRLMPDINKVAPLPVTSAPPPMSLEKLEELAKCCGIEKDQILVEVLKI
jgi:hypothetical protein